MADGEVKIDVGINQNEFSKGLNSIASRLKAFGNSPTLKAMSNVGASITGIGTAFNLVTKAVNAAKAEIDELSQKYNTQKRAEIQLQQAAKNNPYMNSESVAHLKSYVSELQGLTEYGDEELLPFMAQLVSSGRSEQQIMDIMSASVDVAASGVMTLDSAVKYLNSSFSGLTGELGERIPQVKTLTAEELKQGKAVQIVADKYKGMAQEVAKSTGSSQQLKNAVGDLKEELGAPFENAMSPMRIYFTELISGWANAKKAKREYEEETKKLIQSDDLSSTDFIEQWEKEAEKAKENASKKAKKTLSILTGDYSRQLVTTGLNIDIGNPDDFIEKGKLLKNIIDSYAESYNMNASNILALIEKYDLLDQSQMDVAHSIHEIIKAEDEQAKQISKNADEEAKAAEKAAAVQAQLKTEQDARDNLRAAYDETLRQKQEEINQRRINGEEITAEAEAQEMYNTAFAAYIKMMSDPAFAGNSGNYSHEANARAQIADWGSIAGGGELKNQIKDFEQELQAAADEANGIVKDHYAAILESLDAEFKAVIENKYLEEEEKLRIEKEYAEKRVQIVAAKDQEEKNNLDAKLAALKGKNETYYDNYKNKQEEIKQVEEEIQNDAQEKREEILNNKELSEEQVAEALVKLNEETAERMKEIDEAYAQNRTNFAANLTAQISDYTSQTVDVINNAANLILETSKNNAKAEQAALEAKYRNGEISEEEYNAALTESKRKAAREQYKIQMIQWSASILQATANTALGVTQAISEGGAPVGIIMGAIAAAAGAVQIASIIANKPVPPSFSTGGIIGGSSTHGDNIAANLNSREMIMNMGQQKGLWDFINGGSNGQGGANIVINNSAANIATAQPKITRDKIEIMIDARVNESMKKGRYDQSMNEAQTGMTGDYYGI